LSLSHAVRDIRIYTEYRELLEKSDGGNDKWVVLERKFGDKLRVYDDVVAPGVKAYVARTHA
jgi:hypothetical protein